MDLYQINVITEKNFLDYISLTYETDTELTQRFETDLKENYQKKYYKKGLEKIKSNSENLNMNMNMFCSWIIQKNEDNEDFSDLVQEEVFMLGKEQTLKVQEEQIKLITRQNQEKENQLKLLYKTNPDN